jgi:hypothetical protein
VTALAYVPVMEDRRAAHQITMLAPDGRLAVSCTCLRPRPGRPRVYIRVAGRDQAISGADAVAAWRAWHEAEGIAL